MMKFTLVVALQAFCLLASELSTSIKSEVEDFDLDGLRSMEAEALARG